MPTRKPTIKKPEPSMQPDAMDQIAFKLGEISGQLRELIHTINNVSQKQDAMGMRLTAVETAQAEGRGRDGVLSALLKSPALGWLVGAAVSAWAILTGKVHV
jgi:hypothetical protein